MAALLAVSDVGDPYRQLFCAPVGAERVPRLCRGSVFPFATLTSVFHGALGPQRSSLCPEASRSTGHGIESGSQP